MRIRCPTWSLIGSSLALAFIIPNLGQAIAVSQAPTWLKSTRMNRIQERVERTLEWDIRQVRFVWYSSETEFARAHGLKSSDHASAGVLAVTRPSDQSIHFGPRVNSNNFDAVFAHELTHVVLFQKYKSAIPPWLDEGLANWVARSQPADRAFLRLHGYIPIRNLTHPFATSAASADQVRYHYQLSQAAIEFIQKRCDLSDLLQLSVGRRLETYLKTTCGIEDLDRELKAWIELPSGR